MISLDAGVLYDAVNARSPHFNEARALVEGLYESREVVLVETVLIELYGGLLRVGREEAGRVIRAIRSNTNWRIVDVQSSRNLMETVWNDVLSEGCGLDSIRRHRLVQCLRQNDVTVFYTGNPAAYAAIGFTAATNPYGQ